jgi:hypothetical protein
MVGLNKICQKFTHNKEMEKLMNSLVRDRLRNEEDIRIGSGYGECIREVGKSLN